MKKLTYDERGRILELADNDDGKPMHVVNREICEYAGIEVDEDAYLDEIAEKAAEVIQACFKKKLKTSD